MSYHFEKTTIAEISTLRNKYLDSVYEEQELFVELLVQSGDYFIIKSINRIIGYFIKNGNILIEFFLENDCLNKSNEIFEQLLTLNLFDEAYCKSFDSVFLKVCILHNKSVEQIGVLYRDFILKEFERPQEISSILLASFEDIDDVSKFKDEVFETVDEIEYAIRNKGLWLFKNENLLLGFGTCLATVSGRKSYDIGMAVHPQHRRRGYGAFILSYLRDYCLSKGWKPTCGCDINNILSQKTIEKIGYFSKHNLVRFTFR